MHHEWNGSGRFEYHLTDKFTYQYNETKIDLIAYYY